MENEELYEIDYNSNKFSIKCIIVTLLILYIMWILNLLNIFIIDHNIYLIAGIGGTIIGGIAILLSFILDLRKGYVKYILLFFIATLYSFITSCLTYHTTICLVFPIIYSAQYRSKKVVWYSFAITAVSIFFAIFLGYKIGICDANMLFYTSSTTEDFIQNFTLNSIFKEPDYFKFVLFYVIPKIAVVLGAVPLVIHLNNLNNKRTKDLIVSQEKNLNLSKEIRLSQQNVIVSLASMLESRDQITGDHIKNTAKYVEYLINKMKENEIYKEELTDEYGFLIIEAAPLHDIGKVHIPDSILCKNGKLTEEEYSEMKKHPRYGFEIFNNITETPTNREYLRVAKDVCLYHHERFDGKGYPNGLEGTDIPLCGRIMAVADVLDALLSKRQYKEAFSYEKTYFILAEECGKQFDPAILSVLLDNWEEFKNDIYPNNK